tara:strand:+ start:51 stop:350 length:300 start_codon:yes stop_codon:yes gene_type:complete
MYSQSNDTPKTNNKGETNEKNEKNKLNKLYNKLFTPKLNKIVDTIDTIAEENKDDTKSKETKQAEACFTVLGHNMNSICNEKDHDGYGLKFFQCMDCSH